MDLLGLTTNSLLSTSNTPVFGDNAQDLINAGVLNINPNAIIVVNSFADVVDNNDGVTTLREAINQANADSGVDLIVFDRSLFSIARTITLDLGELAITHSLDIIAPTDTSTSGDLLTVSGNQASRVFEIGTGATVTLSGLIVANGNVTKANGGGILNSGTLTLDSSIVRNSAAATDATGTYGQGGGISSSGNLTVINSIISGNSARTGGGIGNLNNGNLTVFNSTITGNAALLSGGGISNNLANVTVLNSSIIGNSATDGGGISNNNSGVTVSHSIISGNLAGRFGGGGIYSDGSAGKVTVLDSSVSGNSSIGFGGGIWNNFSDVTITDSTISGNSGTEYGGGIYHIHGNLTVTGTTIKGNSSTSYGGGISNVFGNVTVTNSTLSDNSAINNGGGFYNNDATIDLTITNSTLSGNSANNGGGIYINSDSTLIVNLMITNSTISGNSATAYGGGIYYNKYYNALTLLFSTITLNQAANGGGVYQANLPLLPSSVPAPNSVRNTIIAANLNSANGINSDVSGDFTSNGYNLIGDSTGSTGFGVTGDIVGTSDNPIDPLLAPLDFNGGPTQTIALLPGSLAISAADPIILESDPTTDQRGLPRRAADGSADIGAFQFS